MNSSFLDDLRGNDLDRVELVMAVEEAFGAYIPPQDERQIRSFRTMQEAINYIQKRLKDEVAN